MKKTAPPKTTSKQATSRSRRPKGSGVIRSVGHPGSTPASTEENSTYEGASANPLLDVDGALAIRPWETFAGVQSIATGSVAIIGRTKPDDRLSYWTDGPQKLNEVLFYPGGGGDWAPLLKFPKCKIFVYCDLGLANSNNNSPLSQLAKEIEDSHPELKYEKPIGLYEMSWESETFDDQMRAWEANAALYLGSLWARPERERGLADEIKHVINTYTPGNQLKRRRTWIGCFERRLPGCAPDYINIVYLTVEGLSGYLNLFFVNGNAPGVICLKPYVGFSCGQLSPGVLGAFGAVLKNDHAAHSSLLVVPPDRKANTPWMSEWSEVRRSFRKWGRTAYATT